MRELRTVCLAFAMVCAVNPFVYSATKPAQPSGEVAQAPNPSASDTQVNEKWMIEGQKRFLINCGRCHQSPHEFSPREMSMAVRHMRVRAMLTQEDTDYLLYFMTHQ